MLTSLRRSGVQTCSGAVALVAIASMSIVLAACGDDSADGSAAPSAADLAGTTFVATEATGETILPDTELRITFDDETLSVNAGCNTFAGGFTIEDDELRTDQLITTLIACDDDLTSQDDWVSALVQGSPAITYVDDVLTLTLGSTSVAMAPES